MDKKPMDINFHDSEWGRAEQKGINRHYFLFHVRQMEQTLARQRSLLAHYSASLRHLRTGLQKIETRLDAIAA